jgi:hypothetical protein
MILFGGNYNMAIKNQFFANWYNVFNNCLRKLTSSKRSVRHRLYGGPITHRVFWVNPLPSLCVKCEKPTDMHARKALAGRKIAALPKKTDLFAGRNSSIIRTEFFHYNSKWSIKKYDRITTYTPLFRICMCKEVLI